MHQRSRLKVGLDVPWVTSWSAEQVLGVRPCPSLNGGLAVVQAEQPGCGRPNYSQNHLVRQRWSVRRMLCPMCGKPTTQDDRWSQTGRLVTAGALRQKGLATLLPVTVPDTELLLDAGAISPAHRACADLALERCPHLQAHANPEPLRFPNRWTVLPLKVEARPQPAHALERRTRGEAVAVTSFLQLLGLPDAA
ncbi:hypothetical protein [Phenylobacterium deserti]|uniref:Uncharacterized protein n=1 Tax=Phenylobacterium deserti TaxID=1914756 RepID=A0A328A9H8_9CAUL|nr:hypothetical protein [Phenylobacterium deserti]RAK51270.1 hypothetical protein DJ018_15085 [Phenylobacterium deserti]